MSAELTPALERKVRSIHDLIESKQYKKALKQCNSCLKKSENSILKTTKAYILQRLGEDDESFALVEEVVSEKPINPSLLDLITIIYKGLNRQDRLNQIYLEGFTKNPSRETGEVLFNSYASIFNYQDQYSIALKLYKTFSDIKYGILAVESMCLIAINDNSQKKLLDLASMFFTKIKQSNEFVKTKEMIEIDILIENSKEKYENVVRILLENKEFIGDAVIRAAEIEEKIGNYEKALNLYASLFDPKEITPDFGIFFKYIDILIKIINEPIIFSPEDFEGPKDNTENTKKSFLLRSFKAITDLNSFEGSFRNFKRTITLSEFYFFYVLRQKNLLSENFVDTLLPKIEKYIRAYHDIPSVVEDIKNSLSLLSETQVSLLLSNLQDLFKEKVSFVSELLNTIVYLKICYKFDRLPNNQILFFLYQNSLEIEQSPKKGEHRLGDQILMMLAKKYPLTSFVSQTLLDLFIQQSPYNYFLKLQLIENYNSTEFCRKIIEVYESLDIKSVQHESLSYLVFRELNDWKL